MQKNFKSSFVIASWFLLLCSSAHAVPAVSGNIALVDSACNYFKADRVVSGKYYGAPLNRAVGTGEKQLDLSIMGPSSGCTADGKFCTPDVIHDKKGTWFIVGIVNPSAPGRPDRVIVRATNSLSSCHLAEEADIAKDRKEDTANSSIPKQAVTEQNQKNTVTNAGPPGSPTPDNNSTDNTTDVAPSPDAPLGNLGSSHVAW
jgi:hypothetical protein